MTTTTKTRTIAYIRVSTAKQADEGVSLDAQRTKLEAYAVALDLEIVAWHVDAGVSAKTLRRPGLQAALEQLEAGDADALLVAKLDRLTRSVRDLGYLVDPQRFGSRWSLLSVADSIDTRSAGGRLVLNVLASVSQWEREAIGERTRDALAEVKRQGTDLGAVPLGYIQARDETGRRQLVEDEGELDTVDAIESLRSLGLSFRAIAERLTTDGRKTKRGGRWHASTVRGVLRRAAA